MAMTTVIVGKIYNGETHTWKDKDKNERTMFRARINYRDRSNGEWYFLDAICWKDFGKEDGLVGFLERNFSADSENAPSEKGGQAIEAVGYFRPVKKIKKQKVKKVLRTKAGSKEVEFDVETEYDTFEFVIDTADFVSGSDSGKPSSKPSQEIDLEEDLEDDDFILEDPKEESSDSDEVSEEDETEAERKAREKKEKQAETRRRNAEKARKAKEEDDDDFFEE